MEGLKTKAICPGGWGGAADASPEPRPLLRGPCRERPGSISGKRSPGSLAAGSTPPCSSRWEPGPEGLLALRSPSESAARPRGRPPPPGAEAEPPPPLCSLRWSRLSRAVTQPRPGLVNYIITCGTCRRRARGAAVTHCFPRSLSPARRGRLGLGLGWLGRGKGSPPAGLAPQPCTQRPSPLPGCSPCPPPPVLQSPLTGANCPFRKTLNSDCVGEGVGLLDPKLCTRLGEGGPCRGCCLFV